MQQNVIQRSEVVGQIAFRMLCASILATLFLPGRLLWLFGVNYLTAEAATLEKVHPSTYLITITATIWFFQVVGDKSKKFLFKDISLVGMNLLAAVLVLFYAAVSLGGQLAPVADSLFCAPLFGIMLHFLSKRQRNIVLSIVLFFVAVNVLIIFYEYATGSPFLPPVFSDLTDQKLVRSAIESEFDGRASGLYGHPLSAGTLTLIFLIGCFETAENLRWRLITLTLAGACVATFPTFGSRWAFILFVFYLFFVGGRFILNMAITRRVSQQSVVILFVICGGALPLGVAAFELGLFDKLIERFEYDPGSAATRTAALDMLLSSDLPELMLGDTDNSLTNKLLERQSANGVEVFWIGFIMRYGVVCAIFYFPALLSFMFQLRRDGGRMGTIVGVAFLASISGSLSILGKTQLFSQVIIFAYAMMPLGYQAAAPAAARAAAKRALSQRSGSVARAVRGQKWLERA